MRRSGVLVLALLPGIAMAGDWEPLEGDALRAALTARTLAYQGGEMQGFFADGRTLYETPEASWGRWRVEGGQYCSQWPPSDLWACYGVERNGIDLRFIAGDGSVTQGRYIDLN